MEKIKVFMQLNDDTGAVMGFFVNAEPQKIVGGVFNGEWAEKLHGKEFRGMNKGDKKQFTGHSSLYCVR